MSSEKRQVNLIDYFIVAGLPDEPRPLQDLPQKANHMQCDLMPITDVAVINKSEGELPPKGFECLEFTTNGYPANLNRGSIMAPEMFLCFRRGLNKPPIRDLGVMYEGKDRPKFGCEVLTSTPGGRSANVNGTWGDKTYINYIRADDKADCDSSHVVDICIILPGKGEVPPRGFFKIKRNMNRGMIGSDMFLCYKNSIEKSNSLNFEPEVLFRYPAEDLPGCPFPQQVAMFCLPMGATIKSWSAQSCHPFPLPTSFVLTGATGEKIYGAAVIFYEEYNESKLRKEQLMELNLISASEKQLSVHQNRAICFLSRCPIFDVFHDFLLYLYRLSVSGPQNVPLERHIGHLMFGVPIPSRDRSHVLVQLLTESVSLFVRDEIPLPSSGASFVQMLKEFGPDNIISFVFYVLMEHRILMHSLRPGLQTSVAEAVVSMIFPFRWKCPYIPLCPLQLAPSVLNSSTPFMIGVDTRCLDMLDLPSDITFVDIDTITIAVCEERKSQNPNILPKLVKDGPQMLDIDDIRRIEDLVLQPLKVLRSALKALYDQLQPISSAEEYELMGRKALEAFEMSIQEAFLRFMVSLLSGYEKFLLPVIEASTDIASTDVKSLFDIEGFLNSREKAHRNFYLQMVKTQNFSRFIHDRSFVSSESIGLAFFDECIRKFERNNDSTLLNFDETSSLSETTVCVLPPEPSSSASGVMFSCKGFSQLQSDLFVQNPKKPQEVAEESSTDVITSGSVIYRNKLELELYQRALLQFTHQAEPMAKCYRWLCYNLWFMCLPSHMLNISFKTELLEDALKVLHQMHQLQMKPLDYVCYDILLHLCYVYNRPALAVKIYHEMKQNHIHPDAILYGFYNRAVAKCDWSSSSSSSVTVGTRMWKKLRNVIFATIILRMLYRERELRRHHDRLQNEDGLNSSYVSNVNEKVIYTTDQHNANAGFDSTNSHAFEFGSGVKRYNGSAAFVESELCTQSKCTNCSKLIHDEEVIFGWSSDDSNLKTRCLRCGYDFVPMIHVNLKLFLLNDGSKPATETDDQESALKNKDSVNVESDVTSDIQPINSSQPISRDVRDGDRISHFPNNRIQTSRLTESNDEVKFDVQLDEDLSQMPSSSLFSKDFGTYEERSRSLCKEESFSVPYLSPVVLKKELENLLEVDKEDCLKKLQLINDHPIVFWNLVWFFKRLHLPSHLYSFIPKSSVFSVDLAKESLPPEGDPVVLVRTLWDGVHTHKEYGIPMYILWKKNNRQMTSENDKVMIFSKSCLQHILSCVVNHDIGLAIEIVLCERNRIGWKGNIVYRSIYYDVLFLSLSVLKHDFNVEEYDALYRKACNGLSFVNGICLTDADRPPRMETFWCRHPFGLLEL